MSTNIGLRKPFFIINTKTYLVGQEIRDLAMLADELAAELDVTVVFTAQYVDLRQIAQATSRLIVTAQHLDAIHPGRGMGRVSPEGLVEAGVGAVFLNHAEHPLTLGELDSAIRMAESVGLETLVCAGTEKQCRAAAAFEPSVVVCEQDLYMGTKTMDTGDYMERTTELVKEISPSTLVVQAAGVSSGADVRRVFAAGADGTGGTTAILESNDQRATLTELLGAVAKVTRGGTPTNQTGS